MAAVAGISQAAADAPSKAKRLPSSDQCCPCSSCNPSSITSSALVTCAGAVLPFYSCPDLCHSGSDVAVEASSHWPMASTYKDNGLSLTLAKSRNTTCCRVLTERHNRSLGSPGEAASGKKAVSTQSHLLKSSRLTCSLLSTKMVLIKS